MGIPEQSATPILPQRVGASDKDASLSLPIQQIGIICSHPVLDALRLGAHYICSMQRFADFIAKALAHILGVGAAP
jgi:hypothetical protein